MTLQTDYIHYSQTNGPWMIYFAWLHISKYISAFEKGYLKITVKSLIGTIEEPLHQPDSMYGVVVRVPLQDKLSHPITYQLYPVFKWHLLTSANWSIPLPFKQPDSIYGVVVHILVQGNIFDPIHYSLFFK